MLGISTPSPHTGNVRKSGKFYTPPEYIIVGRFTFFVNGNENKRNSRPKIIVSRIVLFFSFLIESARVVFWLNNLKRARRYASSNSNDEKKKTTTTTTIVYVRNIKRSRFFSLEA